MIFCKIFFLILLASVYFIISGCKPMTQAGKFKPKAVLSSSSSIETSDINTIRQYGIKIVKITQDDQNIINFARNKITSNLFLNGIKQSISNLQIPIINSQNPRFAAGRIRPCDHPSCRSERSREVHASAGAFGSPFPAFQRRQQRSPSAAFPHAYRPS